MFNIYIQNNPLLLILITWDDSTAKKILYFTWSDVFYNECITKYYIQVNHRLLGKGFYLKGNYIYYFRY
ncbi:hypothetical protein GCM10007978_04320 [Shewanella hanedai]|nr:hypothetical protein GCM10007978_04320 [Shewanella hanedai]